MGFSNFALEGDLAKVTSWVFFQRKRGPWIHCFVEFQICLQSWMVFCVDPMIGESASRLFGQAFRGCLLS